MDVKMSSAFYNSLLFWEHQPSERERLVWLDRLAFPKNVRPFFSIHSNYPGFTPSPFGTDSVQRKTLSLPALAAASRERISTESNSTTTST